MDACSICGTTEDALDNLTNAQLLINQCGHKFCKSCTYRKFSQKSTFSCPVCCAVIKKNTISEKTLDEIEAADDLKVRRRINDIYNKVESDFAVLLDYNDYQEEKEDVIYQLVHNIDRPAVEARVKAYQQAHEDEIRTRLAQHGESDRVMSALVQRQRADNQAAILEVQALDSLSRKVEKELRRQEVQIRMGERTALSDELVAKQKELAAQKHGSSSSQPAPSTVKRPLSSFMQASATGVGGRDGSASSAAASATTASASASAVPKIAEQFLQQRPLPKFIPTMTPAAAPEGHKAAVEHSLRRRAAGGFDASTSGRRNSSEVLGQLQLLVSVSAAAHAAPPVAVCWPRPAR